MSQNRLDPQDCKKFHEKGIIGPFRLFQPDEAPRCKTLIEGLYPGSAPVLKEGNGLLSGHNRHHDRLELRELVQRPALGERVASLLGDDALIWRTHCWCKQPGAAEIPWHQDWNYWPLEPVVVVSAWIAFNEVRRDNSCMQVIPGSHRKVLPHVKSRPGMAFDEEADPSRIPTEGIHDVELDPGEFVLFNERLLHHSEPNRSQRPRLGLAVRCIPSLVRVLEYDSPEHVLFPISGAIDRFGFNRVAVPAEVTVG